MKWIGQILFVITVTTWVSGPVAAQTEANRVILGPDRIYDSAALLQDTTVETEANLQVEPKEKNVKLAMLYSLLLPGLGESYLGHKGRATVFFVAEGAIWTSFAVFRIQGGHREDLYKEFAEVNAGVAQRNDEEFYRTIGNFIAADGPFSANEQVRRQARSIYPNDREKQDEYFEENAYTGDDAWTWSSQDRLDRYGEMRSSAENAYHNSELAVGLLVANRILSVVDVGLLGARSKREQPDDQARLSWNFEAPQGGPGARVTLSRTF